MARRRNKTRRHHRGRFNFLYKLFSVLLICAAIVAALILFFKVETITVTGFERYSKQEVLEKSGVHMGDNLFLLNKYTVRENILRELPYVEQVHITRKLPSTLELTLSECVAAVAVTQGSDVWLISPGGKILQKVTALEGQKYPAVDGISLLLPSVSSQIALPEEKAALQAQLLSLLAALRDAEMLGDLRAIHLGDPSVITMDYADRFVVQMLPEAKFDYKLQNLRAVMENLEINETGTVDLTLDGEAHFIP